MRSSQRASVRLTEGCLERRLFNRQDNSKDRAHTDLARHRDLAAHHLAEATAER